MHPDLRTYADLHADATALLSRWTATSPAAATNRDRTLDLLAAGQSPILCLTHPNNWISGLRLWIARAVHAVRLEGDRPPL